MDVICDPDGTKCATYLPDSKKYHSGVYLGGRLGLFCGDFSVFFIQDGDISRSCFEMGVFIWFHRSEGFPNCICSTWASWSGGKPCQVGSLFNAMCYEEGCKLWWLSGGEHLLTFTELKFASWHGPCFGRRQSLEESRPRGAHVFRRPSRRLLERHRIFVKRCFVLE